MVRFMSMEVLISWLIDGAVHTCNISHGLILVSYNNMVCNLQFKALDLIIVLYIPEVFF